MPLRDHFHGSLTDTHSWDELHGVWPGQMVQQLFGILPSGYRPSASIHLASSFEIDVVTFEMPNQGLNKVDSEASTESTLLSPEPTLTVEHEQDDSDAYEILVYDTRQGRELVAAIEIVSPSNQDRPQARDHFLTKITTLLNQGVCVSVIDLVTSSHTSFYDEMLMREGLVNANDESTEFDSQTYSFTVRKRNQPLGNKGLRDYWFYPISIGQPLPTIPIWLSPTKHIMLPLETSYEETCRLLHIK